jgi:peptide/nickel transport system substrate-binding protein
MKKFKKLVVVSLACVLVALGFSGCGSSTSSDKNTLVYGSGDYDAINPALYEHGEINSLIFAGLMAHDEKDQVVAGMADKWDWDEATLTYSFHLRDNLKWQDGEKLTAKDVKFTLDAIMDPKNASEIVSNYEDITKIEVVDDQNIKITLNAPNVAMLDYLTIGILPAHLLEGKDLATDDFNHHPVGSGPYKLTSWDEGQSITMEKFDGYYAGTPKIDKIIFKIVTDTKARALQLKSGELDLAQVVPTDVSQFQNDSKYKVYDMKTSDYRGIMYNFNNKLFKDNPDLPKALNYAIDRHSIVSTVLLGNGQVAYGPLQKSQYNNPNVEQYAYDPAEAESLLQEQGWAKNANGIYEKNGTPLAFKINCMEGDQERVDIANIAAQNLQAIGVNATVSVNAKTDWDNQETFLIGWGSPFDPDDHTYKVFGTNKGSNYNAYSNAKVDELLTKARQTENAAERKTDYDAFQVELANQPPYTFICYIDAFYVGNSNIKGITEDTLLGHHGVGIFYNVAQWSLSE